MADICFDGIRHLRSTIMDAPLPIPTQWKGANSTESVLWAIAGVAVAVAVPFVAPALAGFIFGSGVMASAWGAVAAAGTGAVLGGVGAYLTGGDPLLGAIGGGVGAGAVQGLGAFGAVGAGGATVLGNVGAGLVGNAIAGMGGPAVGAASGAAGLAGTAAAGLGAAGSLVAPSVGGAVANAGLGAAAPSLAIPWDKLGAAAIQAAPAALGAAAAGLMPASAEATAADAQAKQVLEGQQTEYEAALRQIKAIDPDYFAQNAANAAKLRVASATAEGVRSTGGGLNDPARMAAENRRNAVASVNSSGQAYNDAYVNALGRQYEATSRAGLLRPNYSDYYKTLDEFGTSAEERKRAEEIAKLAGPFATAFAPSANPASNGIGNNRA